MNQGLTSPVVVDFPLRGANWVAVNSPGDRVPSHGTDLLGQRFAFDFLHRDSISNGIPNRADRIRST